MMKRREFITLLAGAVATPALFWPLARAQQPGRMRRIVVFINEAEDDPEARLFVEAFLQGLQQLGWTETDGSNVRIDYHWGAGDADRYRRYAAELVALAPDVILATATSVVQAMQKASRTAPIVFVNLIDPVGSGVVASLVRTGSNATGFTSVEYGMSAKWLELLKEIAPCVTRVARRNRRGRAVRRNPGRGAVVRGGVEPDRCTRRRRDRARHDCICAGV